MKRRSFLIMLGLAPIAPAAASETISEARIISCKIAEETICAPKIVGHAITADRICCPSVTLNLPKGHEGLRMGIMQPDGTVLWKSNRQQA